jgi:hypothetical protein
LCCGLGQQPEGNVELTGVQASTRSGDGALRASRRLRCQLERTLEKRGRCCQTGAILDCPGGLLKL